MSSGCTSGRTSRPYSASQGQVGVFAEALAAPVTTHRFTAAEGAGGHCEGLGQRRLERVAYDWIEAVLPG